MRKCWKVIRVGTLIASLSLTTALPVFANSNQNPSERVEASKISFEDILVSSLAAAGLSPAVVIAAIQKVREAAS